MGATWTTSGRLPWGFESPLFLCVCARVRVGFLTRGRDTYLNLTVVLGGHAVVAGVLSLAHSLLFLAGRGGMF